MYLTPPGSNVTIDDMRIAVDIVGIETINKLLELGVIQNLPPDPGGVAGVVGELDRVDGVHLGTEV